mgnify:CR=1 FL=1
MKRSLLFYIAGGLLGLVLFIYVVYLINFTARNISVVSGTNLLNVPEIATYNFAKFKQIKGVSQ